eukprot:11156140-Heterocapsa_arctica.AAC.1
MARASHKTREVTFQADDRFMAYDPLIAESTNSWKGAANSDCKGDRGLHVYIYIRLDGKWAETSTYAARVRIAMAI